ncbi:single-stranded DNA-binding protein [Homoserinibacter sp. YIM 151385]|uniref:single-stranded DNA-binding protein n=1 Tax=Homoserinibacter sp. YIM 151385 TaxID=2985506 RepID=UPI0022F0D430|nr:single-stranded DNA-binding protein [Homoserinibacter sp. YIM 151385]WBU39050.1 single-stranded DNA-binding protein [Homoserinibacter sp. YIM 151385]
MADTITLTGVVATPPRHVETGERLHITSFRLASTQRRFDRAQQKWVDGDTNWYTVTAFRQLAVNAAASIEKGQRVVVSGRLRIRDWTAGERSGTNIEIDAEMLGHDLAWGTSRFTRTSGAGDAAAGQAAQADPGAMPDAAPAPAAEQWATPGSGQSAETSAEPAPELLETPF